ncbi:MAG: hypothetical protein J5881_01665 [Clostridia bacterium]|nr:hypothetical protein [Clostridia bacterium]
MKKDKLKLISLILLVILIIMVGFFGVYSNEKGSMKNGVKDYEYTTNIKGARVANLELSSATDAATHENYELTRQIIKARLEKMGVTNYVLRLDEETGKIIIELPEDDNTDNILNVISTVGKFEIVDAETNEVLLNNNDISESNIYRNTTSYGTEMSFSIEFTSDGAKKLEEISKTYVPAKEETTEENTEEVTETEEVENSEETSTEENKEKKVSLKLDDTELMSTNFEEPVTTGKMYLTVGQAATTTDDVKSNYTQAQRMATLLSTKPLPLTYENNSSTFVQGALNENITNTMLIGVAIIVAIAIVVLLVKFKKQGLFSGICFAGLAALLLLTVRYWNVALSKEGIVAIFAVLVLNFILVYKILNDLRKEKDNKKEETKHVINMAIKDFTLKVIPLFIFAVVFAFGTWEAASSFGMVMFWGLSLIELYNLFITKNILK